MNIGILTFHDGANHGAFLQAYASQQYLKSLGHMVKIINYRSLKHFYKEKRATLVAKRLPEIKQKWQKVATFKKAHQQYFDQTAFYFSLKNIGHFDAIVIGSDEIWNLKNTLSCGDLAYFGQGLEGQRLISYAPSFGNTKLADIPNASVGNLLKNFSALSVRDENSAYIVKSLTGIEPTIVVDPTFLYDFPETSSANLGEAAQDDDTLVLYTPILEEQYIPHIQNYARERNLKIVSLGYYMPWADKNVLNLDPFEWIAYLQKAKYVVSASFHGIIFAIKAEIPFCACLHPSRRTKALTLLERLHLKDQLATNATEMQQVFETTTPDYSEVKPLLNDWRQLSEDFLKNAIK